MKPFYVFLILFYYRFISSACPVVDCSSSLPDGVCYLQDSLEDPIKVKRCSSGQVCQVNQMYSTYGLNFTISPAYCVEETYIPDLKYPGEECNEDHDCKYKNCISGICKGTQQGQTCEEQEECDVGFTCISNRKTGICKEQVQIGGSCISLYDCVNNANCFRGKCVEYFSIEIGEQFDSNDEASPLLCESGYYDASKTCMNPPRNKRKYNHACESHSDCKVEFVGSDQDDKNGFCACGMNKEGKAFCRSQPGDDEFLNFKTAMLNLSQINQNCHTALAFSRRCKDISNTYELDDFLITYYRYRYRYLLISQPSCVTDTITPFAEGYDTDEYTEVTETNDTLVIIVLVVVFTIIALIGFTCFICVKRLVRFRRAGIDDVNSDNSNGTHRVVMSRILFRDPAVRDSSVFMYDDLELDDHTAFLKKGVPISQKVAYESYEDIQENIEYEEADKLNISNDFEQKPEIKEPAEGP